MTALPTTPPPIIRIPEPPRDTRISPATHIRLIALHVAAARPEKHWG